MGTRAVLKEALARLPVADSVAVPDYVTDINGLNVPYPFLKKFSNGMDGPRLRRGSLMGADRDSVVAWVENTEALRAARPKLRLMDGSRFRPTDEFRQQSYEGHIASGMFLLMPLAALLLHGSSIRAGSIGST
ncbi:MAG: hypothetical protein IPG10_01165 [Flavobacteriales bacterium]|nr:hypothetical protein [Flavobacteriales bacterium]